MVDRSECVWYNERDCECKDCSECDMNEDEDEEDTQC